MFPCRYSSNNICTVVEEWTQGYCCLGYFSSSTHSDLVMRLAQKVWRQCVLVVAHDLVLRDGNCIGLLANTGLFLSTDNRYLFLLQRRLIPFNSLPRLQIQFSRQRFVIGVSDLYTFSPWFSAFDCKEPISSDESHVVQFQHVFELIRLTYPQFVQTFQNIVRVTENKSA